MRRTKMNGLSHWNANSSGGSGLPACIPTTSNRSLHQTRWRRSRPTVGVSCKPSIAATAVAMTKTPP